MANIHVLEKNGNAYRLAFHIPIPNANNGAAVNYRTALINSGIGGLTVLKDGNGQNGTIDTATEKVSIGNGSLYEIVMAVDMPPGLSGQALLDFVNANYTANSAVVLADLQAKLQQYGRVI